MRGHFLLHYSRTRSEQRVTSRIMLRVDDNPVVLVTASGEEGDIGTGDALGAKSDNRTPVTFERFAAGLRTPGTYRLPLNEPLTARGARW